MTAAIGADVIWQRVDADQVQVVEIDGCLAVDAGVGRPERDLAGLRVDQPPVLVAVLVGQRVADLLQVETAQIQHQARIDRSSSCSAEQSNARLRHERMGWRLSAGRLKGLTRIAPADLPPSYKGAGD